MALEPITRQEKIIAGQDLTPITRMEKFLKNFGGGGGSVPKPLTYDYMPEGYPSKSVETTTLMEEQELAFDEDGFSPLPSAIELAEGTTYTVTWDGYEYDCVGVDIDSSVVLGNLSIMGLGDDTGEPFLIVPPEGSMFTSETTASHTISIKIVQETVTKMAEEFLPSDVNELIMNSSTPDSTKKFKIAVDDTGTISATEVT